LPIISKTALVLPGLAREPFSWDAREGWAVAGESLGWSFKSFWVRREKPDVRRLIKDLRKYGPDWIYFLGGDHHLFPLHRHPDDRKRWQDLPIPKICNCDERILGSPYPDSLLKTASALATFDAFTYSDESSTALFEGQTKPYLWWTQYVDPITFRSRIPFRKKEPLVFFRGQLDPAGQREVYRERFRVIDSVRGKPGFLLEEAYKPLLSVQEAVSRKDRYAVCLHAPSNCPGMVSSFYEGAALGCLVLQYRLSDSFPKSRALFEAGKHFIEYDSAHPEKLTDLVRGILSNLRDYESIARQGQEETLSKHTIPHRLQELERFVQAHWAQLKKN
jgi:hypothetical protein